jgi:hypothetical protein
LSLKARVNAINKRDLVTLDLLFCTIFSVLMLLLMVTFSAPLFRCLFCQCLS